jgi:hypothetical protein
MRSMHATKRKTGRGRAMLCALLTLALGGCAAELAARDDARVVVRGDRVYVVASEPAALRSICASLGQTATASPPSRTDVSARGEHAAAPLRCAVHAGHVIVCADGDLACVAHEERHAREGNFHR